MCDNGRHDEPVSAVPTDDRISAFWALLAMLVMFIVGFMLGAAAR